MIDIDSIEKTTETRVVEGIRLPFTTPTWTGRGSRRKRVGEEIGELFVEESTLVALCEQGRWDSQFGSVLILGYQEGLALEQAGLAEQETKGGYHGTDAVKALCKRLGWF